MDNSILQLLVHKFKILNIKWLTLSMLEKLGKNLPWVIFPQKKIISKNTNKKNTRSQLKIQKKVK